MGAAVVGCWLRKMDEDDYEMTMLDTDVVIVAVVVVALKIYFRLKEFLCVHRNRCTKPKVVSVG